MSRRATIYLSDATLSALGEPASLSGAINRAVDRLHETVRRSNVLDYFSEAEQNAILNACNGWLAEPAATIAGGVALEIADAIPDGIGEKWGIAPQALIAKLRTLSFADEVALVAKIEDNWRNIEKN